MASSPQRPPTGSPELPRSPSRPCDPRRTSWSPRSSAGRRGERREERAHERRGLGSHARIQSVLPSVRQYPYPIPERACGGAKPPGLLVGGLGSRAFTPHKESTLSLDGGVLAALETLAVWPGLEDLRNECTCPLLGPLPARLNILFRNHSLPASMGTTVGVVGSASTYEASFPTASRSSSSVSML